MNTRDLVLIKTGINVISIILYMLILGLVCEEMWILLIALFPLFLQFLFEFILITNKEPKQDRKDLLFGPLLLLNMFGPDTIFYFLMLIFLGSKLAGGLMIIVCIKICFFVLLAKFGDEK